MKEVEYDKYEICDKCGKYGANKIDNYCVCSDCLDKAMEDGVLDLRKKGEVK